MANIYLEHNPFLETTKCIINGEDVTQKDSLKKCWGDPNKSLLQDWVDKFFDTLSNFINERSYDIDFFGLPSDYEDLEDAKNEFCKNNPEYSIKIKPVDNDIKSYKRRIKELRELFEHAQQNSLYNEFKMDETKDVFDIALSNEEEIGVVATVSSGKSTLVNAMLHKRILPAKNKATTAVVTKIFNEKSKKEFTVSANDKDGICVCDNEIATYDIIDKLNNAENIKDLKLYGSIPNIKGYGLKVVLNDTPGPNNSEDEKHRALTYELINKTYKPMILYILDATKLKVDDDKKLLQYISEKMKDSGVQSKDRFIFVLNKADALDPESQDGESAEEAIKDLRKYLKNFEINNPKIFPVSAKLSSFIRSKENLSKKEEDFLNTNIDDFISSEKRHLHKFASLSNEGRRKVEELIQKAKDSNDRFALADIYSGVPALEIAINEYLEKYAIRQKIKEPVRLLKKTIDFQKIKIGSLESINKHEEHIKDIEQTLENIREAIEKGDKVKKLKNQINEYNFNDDIEKFFTEQKSNLAKKILEIDLPKKMVSADKSKPYLEKVRKVLEDYRGQYLGCIENEINKSFLESIKNIFSKYRDYVKDLMLDEYDFNKKFGENFSINSVININFDEESIISNFKTVDEKKVQYSTGNKDKAWYKPWTWGDDEYKTFIKIEKEEKFDFEKFKVDYLSKLYRNIDEECRGVKKEISDKLEDFKEFFSEKIDELNKIISERAKEQLKVFKDKKQLNKMIEIEREKIVWLDGFNEKLDSILAIQGAKNDFR